jgi:hypothetical protein
LSLLWRATTGETAVTYAGARFKMVDLFDRICMCVQESSNGSICGRKPGFGNKENFGN